MKKIFAVFPVVLCLVALSASAETKAPDYCQYYPHWSNCATSTDLKKLEVFIDKYQADASKYSVAFDWDGTLYNEKIPVKENGKTLKRSGQSVWHIWGANQIISKHDAAVNQLFPSFKQMNADDKTINYQAWADNIKYLDNYAEGLFKTYGEDRAGVARETKVPDDVYDKFSAIASFEVGMTFGQMREYLGQYLADYSAKQNAFLKMFDVMHRLSSAGFHVWIITGSNPYFVANVLTDGKDSVNGIKDLGYTLLPSCQEYMDKSDQDLAELTPEQFFTACPIAGNANVWPGGDAKIVRRYDARNFNHADDYVMAIDRYGKWLTAQHIVDTTKHPLIFYAGNSDGDYNLMKQILANKFKAPHGTFGVFVQPNLHDGGRLLTYLYQHRCTKEQCIKVSKPN